jgi:sulfur relay (sulfurtransferase) DsrF/TusC family protein
MTTDFCVLFRRAPYGSILAAEGIRHLIGAMENDLTVVAVLVDDGVWVARMGQESGATGWTSLSGALASALGTTDGATPQILVDQDALVKAGLRTEDLVPGVRPVSPEAVAEVVATARHLIIF